MACVDYDGAAIRADCVTYSEFDMAVIHESRLRQLIDDRAAALRLYAGQWCREPDDAVQEAFLALALVDPAPENEVAWLYAAVRHKALNAARAESRRHAHHQRAAEARTAFFQPTEGSFDRSELEEALRDLAPLRREIVVARIWGELTFEEIAGLVDRPLTSVHRHYTRALEQLAERLTPSLVDREQNHECPSTS